MRWQIIIDLPFGFPINNIISLSALAGGSKPMILVGIRITNVDVAFITFKKTVQ